MKIEQILEDAETSAAYYRALVDKGVPPMSAVTLTSSYMQSVFLGRCMDDEGKKPWEDPR